MHPHQNVPYEAMMEREYRGAQPKIHVLLKSNLTSDERNADESRKQMELSKKRVKEINQVTEKRNRKFSLPFQNEIR